MYLPTVLKSILIFFGMESAISELI